MTTNYNLAANDDTDASMPAEIYYTWYEKCDTNGMKLLEIINDRTVANYHQKDYVRQVYWYYSNTKIIMWLFILSMLIMEWIIFTIVLRDIFSGLLITLICSFMITPCCWGILYLIIPKLINRRPTLNGDDSPFIVSLLWHSVSTRDW